MPKEAKRRVGSYLLHGEFSAGGMATVHFGRVVGAPPGEGVVAIKRLHAHYAKVSEFVSRFTTEAHLAMSIRHPNVVTMVDVVRDGDELFLVMEYVPGESLSGLLDAGAKNGGAARVPLGIAVRIVSGVLRGLQAAHEAKDAHGQPLHIVHRDVSPSNVLVGVDGVARLLDFGVAKAAVSLHTTKEGHLKGKLRYMAPERIRDSLETHAADVYAASVVLWEMITGTKLFAAGNEAAIMAKVLEGVVVPPGRMTPGVPKALDDVVLRGLARDPAQRFASAREMAEALDRALTPAPREAVAEWVRETAADTLRLREAQLCAMHENRAVPQRADAIGAGASGGERARDAGETTHTDTLVESAPAEGAEARGDLLRDKTASEARAPKSRTRGRAFGALLAAGLVVVVAGGIALRARARSTPPSPSTSPATSTSTSTSTSMATAIAPASPTTPAVGAESSGAAELASASPSSASPASAPPPPTAAPAHAHRTGGGRAAGRAAQKASEAKPDCSPPYYEDSSGIRHAKRECL